MDEDFQTKLDAAYKWLGTLNSKQAQHIFTLQTSTIDPLVAQRQALSARLVECENLLFNALSHDDVEIYKAGWQYINKHRPELDKPFG